MTMEKLLNTEEGVDFISINYTNTTNDISINDDDNLIHKYYAPFLSEKNHEALSSVS